MNEAQDVHGVPHGLADVPLTVRRRLEVEKQRELHNGLTRRHLDIATYRQRYLAAQFARVLSVGPALAAKLRGEIETLLRRHASAPMFGLAGVELVNVVEVNLALTKEYGPKVKQAG